MKIGLGGESNWATHTESAAHRKNEASKNTSRSLQPAAAPSLLPNPTLSFSGSSQAGPSSTSHVVDTPNDEPIVIDSDSDGSPPPPPTMAPSTDAVSTTSLLSELECVSVTLPLSISEGTDMDVLAQFSRNPVLELEAGQDAWEMADGALNGTIGYDKTVEDITKIIQRGMDGLCTWLRILVCELQVDDILLEG